MCDTAHQVIIETVNMSFTQKENRKILQVNKNSLFVYLFIYFKQ